MPGETRSQATRNKAVTNHARVGRFCPGSRRRPAASCLSLPLRPIRATATVEAAPMSAAVTVSLMSSFPHEVAFNDDPVSGPCPARRDDPVAMRILFSSPRARLAASIHDEQRRSCRGRGAMRLGMIGNLIADAGTERKSSAVTQLCLELADEAQ